MTDTGLVVVFCAFPVPGHTTANKKTHMNRFMLASLRRCLAAHQSFDFVWDSIVEESLPVSLHQRGFPPNCTVFAPCPRTRRGLSLGFEETPSQAQKLHRFWGRFEQAETALRKGLWSFPQANPFV
jgi:hypothetical protein